MGCFHSSPSLATGQRAAADPRTALADSGNPVSRTDIANAPQGLRERLSRSQQQPSSPSIPKGTQTTLKPARPWRTTDTDISDSSRSVREPWTPRLLRRERSVFFDTRVSGRPELWQAVQLAVQMARDSGDLQGAFTVLDAAGFTIPKGRIEDGVWDESGVLYFCPQWVVSDPADLDMDGDDGEGGHADENTRDGRGAGLDTDNDEDEKAPDDDGEAGEAAVAERRRSEKGKGRGRDAVKVRARLSDRGTDVVILLEKNQTVRSLIRRVREEAKIATGIKMKIAYLGRILKEGETLENQGWKQGHVVNVLVFQT